MNRSCLSPSPVLYSHTQACSCSSNLDGCCKAFGGIMMSSKNPRLTGNRVSTVKQHNLVLLHSVKHISIYRLLQHQVNVRRNLVLLHSVKHINIFKLLQHQVSVRKYYKMKTNCVCQSPKYGSLVMLLKFLLAAKRI